MPAGVLFVSCIHKGFCFVLQFGSAVKLPGSGGAVVGLCLDNARLVRPHYVEVVECSVCFKGALPDTCVIKS